MVMKKISKISSRFKALANKARFFILKDGNIVSEKYSTFNNIPIAGDVGDGDLTIANNQNTENGLSCLSKNTNGSLKILCRAAMSKNEYVNKIVISSAAGQVVVKMTPYISMNPFLGVDANLNYENLDIKYYVSTDSYVDNGSIENNSFKNFDPIINLKNNSSSNNWTKAN
jgi:hypothetical protein